MNVSEIFAGDTLQFDVSVPDYPASDGYTLTYRLVPRGSGSAQQFDATADGDGYTVNVAAATTAAWTAGEYSWSSWVTLSGARYTVGQGLLTIKPDPSAMSVGTDTRSHAERVLDAIEALLEGRAGSDVMSYTIAGRSVDKMAPEELLKWRSFYAAEVKREQAAAALVNGLQPRGRLLVRL